MTTFTVPNRVKRLIEANGGGTFTWPSLKPADHEDGYYVSILPIEFSVGTDTDTTPHYITTPISPELDRTNLYIGFWRDPDTDVWYVDWTEHNSDLSAALATAELLGELAIWDIANQGEIRVS